MFSSPFLSVTFFSILGMESILGPFGTAATPGLLYLPRVIMRMEKLVEWTVLAEETQVLGENLPQCHFVHHKFHMTWPRLEPPLPLWEAASNRLSYGMAPYPAREASSRSPTLGIPNISFNSNVHYRINISLPLLSILSHMNPLHMSILFKIHFNVIHLQCLPYVVVLTAQNELVLMAVNVIIPWQYVQ
jgi:hypothetical protein